MSRSLQRQILGFLFKFKRLYPYPFYTWEYWLVTELLKYVNIVRLLYFAFSYCWPSSLIKIVTHSYSRTKYCMPKKCFYFFECFYYVTLYYNTSKSRSFALFVIGSNRPCKCNSVYLSIYIKVSITYMDIHLQLYTYKNYYLIENVSKSTTILDYTYWYINIPNYISYFINGWKRNQRQQKKNFNRHTNTQ